MGGKTDSVLHTRSFSHIDLCSLPGNCGQKVNYWVNDKFQFSKLYISQNQYIHCPLLNLHSSPLCLFYHHILGVEAIIMSSPHSPLVQKVLNYIRGLNTYMLSRSFIHSQDLDVDSNICNGKRILESCGREFILYVWREIQIIVIIR